jgi:nitrite reductase (NO-forming)
MQGDFYTVGAYGDPGLQPFDMNKALMEHPDYVVFNGSVGALVGDNAITAEVGETIRLFVGNGGPNLVSSFHVIGEIFDLVYPEGGFPPVQNVQTTLIPSGGATIVEFRVEVPGTFIIVDHSIFRTFNKGSLGMLKVGGDENPTVYTGREDDRIYLPEGGAAQRVPGLAPPTQKALTKEDRIKAGERVYNQVCFACHQATGLGIPNAFPPLAQSDFLLADPRDGAAGIIFGRQGEIVVNGKKYNGVMPALALSDEEIASVITYVLNSWGNDGGELTPDIVKEVRASR